MMCYNLSWYGRIGRSGRTPRRQGARPLLPQTWGARRRTAGVWPGQQPPPRENRFANLPPFYAKFGLRTAHLTNYIKTRFFGILTACTGLQPAQTHTKVKSDFICVSNHCDSSTRFDRANIETLPRLRGAGGASYSSTRFDRARIETRPPTRQCASRAEQQSSSLITITEVTTRK